MKHELQKHLIPLFIIFVITTVLWILNGVVWYQYVFLILGFGLGSFFLDIDHLIYWYYRHPELEESKTAILAIEKKDFKNTLLLLESTHKLHTDLLFHHIIFQLVLIAVSFFVFTSSDIIFGKAFLLALNIHLLVDQYEDFRLNPRQLQLWLFARLPQQIPLNFLGKYLLIVLIFVMFFTFLLIKSFL